MKSPRKWWRDLQRTRLAAKLLEEALGDNLRLLETEGITAYIRLQHREIRNLQESRCRAKQGVRVLESRMETARQNFLEIQDEAFCLQRHVTVSGAKLDPDRIAALFKALGIPYRSVRLSMADRATPAIKRTIAKLSEPEVQA